jgi:hypothetical protein
LKFAPGSSNNAFCRSHKKGNSPEGILEKKGAHRTHRKTQKKGREKAAILILATKARSHEAGDLIYVKAELFYGSDTMVSDKMARFCVYVNRIIDKTALICC